MLDKIISVSKEAGEIIKNGFKSNISIEFKTDASNIVTNIDKASEKVITDFIKKEYPNHTIIAEETGLNEKNSEYKWIIDPLDGTTNFAHGLPIFSISIGVQKNEETIYGVIYDVMQDKVFSAEKGSGAFENNVKIKVSENSNLSESLLVTGFPYEVKNNYEEAIIHFTTFLKKSRAVRRLGSAAIDFCFVANGVFDGFWESKLNSWDVCAGLILVEEAGGKISNYSGNPVTVNSPNFLATNGKVHSQMIEVLKSK
ncbi:MAG: inositol monophosphatase [Ignavibacteriales bacterium]|nr:inositol monophosphatase [Ignavibacteriales bacterium]MBK7980342.1 inositol monophosphatase [Ignavibacteriota bacterium]